MSGCSSLIIPPHHCRETVWCNPWNNDFGGHRQYTENHPSARTDLSRDGPEVSLGIPLRLWWCLMISMISGDGSEMSYDQRPSSAPDSTALHLQRASSEPQLRPRSEQGSRSRSQRSQSKPGPVGPASQRFSKDELQCFKRIPGPSSNFDEKLAV